MEFINEAILHAAGQWWIYPILTIFCFIDGFVPILPSETLIVALGATAARSLTGRNVAITTNRGSILESEEGVPVLVTIHPSYLLRLPDAELAAQERRNFVADLMQARERIEAFQMAAT